VGEPLSIVAGRSDAAVAEDVRVRLVELLKPVCDVLNEARALGLSINFSTATDPIGSVIPGPIVIARHY